MSRGKTLLSLPRPDSTRTGLLLTLWALSSFAATGCGGDKPTDPPPTTDMQPNLASIQAEVFTPRCATSNCHDSEQLEGGLNLEAGEAFANLVGVEPTTFAASGDGMLRVDPGDPTNSFLLMKLRGPDAIYGDRMPYNGPYLNSAEIDVIQAWIASGALPDTTSRP